MNIIETKNTDYNSMLIFKTYMFNKDESNQAQKEIEISFDIPFYKDEYIDFNLYSKDLTIDKERRLLFMGLTEEQLDEIKQKYYLIVTCVHQ